MRARYTPESAGPSTRRAAQSEPTVVYTEFEDMSKAELQAAAEARGLATSGTKAELIERLSE